MWVLELCIIVSNVYKFGYFCTLLLVTLVLTDRLLAEDEVTCLSYCNHPHPTHHTALVVFDQEGSNKLNSDP